MRFLGSEFGYLVACMPTLGQVQSTTGERKTCIYTMQRYTTVQDNVSIIKGNVKKVEAFRLNSAIYTTKYESMDNNFAVYLYDENKLYYSNSSSESSAWVLYI